MSHTNYGQVNRVLFTSQSCTEVGSLDQIICTFSTCNLLTKFNTEWQNAVAKLSYLFLNWRARGSERQLELITAFSGTPSPSIRALNESGPLTTLATCLLNLALHQQTLKLRIVHGTLILPLDSYSSKTVFPWQAKAGQGTPWALSMAIVETGPRLRGSDITHGKHVYPYLSTMGTWS